MGDLATLPTFQPTPANYTASDFNAAFANLTIAPNAVTFAKFQAIGTASLLGRHSAGTGNVEQLTAEQGREVLELGSMATQDNDTVEILDGTAILDIAELNKLKLVPETNYATNGSIAIAMDGKTNARILLDGNATFSLTGIAAGTIIELSLLNNTAGDITLAWPAFKDCGGVPKRLAAGQSALVRIMAYGTDVADCYARGGPENHALVENSVTGNIATGTAGADFDYTGGPSVDLTTGVWLVWGSAAMRTTDTLGEFWLGLRDASASADFGFGSTCKNYDLHNIYSLCCFGILVVSSGTKTIRLKGFRQGSVTLEMGSTNGFSGQIRALRIRS